MKLERELACRQVVELVTAYLDDQLSAADRVGFDAHLAGCDDCSTYVAQFVHTLNALGAMPREELDPRALDALLAVFHDRAR